MEKISYECRIYESVDDMNLSLVISQKSKGKSSGGKGLSSKKQFPSLANELLFANRQCL